VALLGLGDFGRLPPSVFLLAAARCVNTFGFSLVMPYLAFHLTAHSGVSMTTVGGIYTVAGVLGAAAQLVGGELSDRLGRRRVMVVALGLRGFGIAALGLALQKSAPLPVLTLLVVVNSMLRSAFEPAAHAQAAVLTGPSSRAAAFGLQRVGINLGWALGPALGGLFASRAYGPMFFAAAWLILMATVGCALVPDGPAKATETTGPTPGPTPGMKPEIPTDRIGRIGRFGRIEGQKKEDPVLGALERLLAAPRPRTFVIFLGATFLMSILTTQLYSTLSVYAMGRLHIPEARFGLLYTINGAMVVLLQGLGVTMINRFGLERTLLIGPLCYAMGYLAFGWAGSYGALGMAVALVTCGELLTEPSEMMAAVALGDPARPGRAIGVFGLLSSLGNSLGPSVGALLYDHTAGHPLRLWGTIAAIGLLGAAGYHAVGAIETKPEAESKAKGR
jgi:predicted MFS family arabinose efflux permease